jgi:hypothetical protein
MWGNDRVSSPQTCSEKLEGTSIGKEGSGDIIVELAMEVVLPGSGHLVPLEDVHILAEAACI